MTATVPQARACSTPKLHMVIGPKCSPRQKPDGTSGSSLGVGNTTSRNAGFLQGCSGSRAAAPQHFTNEIGSDSLRVAAAPGEPLGPTPSTVNSYTPGSRSS